MIFVNELHPTWADVQTLRGEIKAGLTDVYPPRSTEDEHLLVGRRERGSPPPAFSFGFRLQRAFARRTNLSGLAGCRRVTIRRGRIRHRTLARSRATVSSHSYGVANQPFRRRHVRRLRLANDLSRASGRGSELAGRRSLSAEETYKGERATHFSNLPSPAYGAASTSNCALGARQQAVNTEALAVENQFG